MRTSSLQEILDSEGSDFFPSTNKWRPQNLIPHPYRRELLQDVEERFRRLDLAEDEFKALPRPALYMGAIKNMRFSIRRAMYAWRADDVAFIEAIAEFFTEYGTVLQNLRRDWSLGHLADTTAE